MPGKTTVFANDILKLIFHGVAISSIADNAATSPLTALYLSLHSADPTDAAASGQATSEVSYTGYARVLMSRNSSAWSITGDVVATVADIDFGKCTAGSGSITHIGIGSASSGTGKLLYSGALKAPIGYASGTIPRIESGSTITEG